MLSPLQSGVSENFSKAMMRRDFIIIFIEFMNEAYIERTYSEAENKRAVNGTLSKQSLFSTRFTEVYRAIQIPGQAEDKALSG